MSSGKNSTIQKARLKPLMPGLTFHNSLQQFVKRYLMLHLQRQSEDLKLNWQVKRRRWHKDG
jgi:hypothetical protein